MNKIELLGVAITILIVSLLVYSVSSWSNPSRVETSNTALLEAAHLRCDKSVTNVSPLISSGTATSGKLFKGEKIADFSGTRKFSKLIDLEKEHQATKRGFKLGSLKCDKWAVVTTIFEPTDAIRRQALIPDWCIVVVGDKKGPKSFEIEAPLKNFIFLTAGMQEEMGSHFPLIGILPWNHFGRKNVGYLYAILHGAQIVYDFDDDNNLISEHHVFDIPGIITAAPATTSSKHVAVAARASSSTKPAAGEESTNTTNAIASSKRRVLTTDVYAAFEPDASYDSLVFNPYPLMGMTKNPCWPRGFPLDRIKPNSSSVTHEIPMVATDKVRPSDVGIVQYLANHDPDVDAIYRLTQPLPFTFPQKGPTLLVPKGSYAPYNAQATLHTYSALWSLLLPVTVHGRVSDIWRGYAAQRVGMDFGMRLAFAPPAVEQIRNPHNYLADFDSEAPLYLTSLRLVEQINEWHSKAATLPGRIEDLWILMYEHGYLQLKDVELLQAWLTSLISAGYRFPVIQSPNTVYSSHNHRRG
jgi:hypothetical protein